MRHRGGSAATPEFPLTVRWLEDGEAWVLDTKDEVPGTLEWFDTDDPLQHAEVYDAHNRAVRLKVANLRVEVLELRPTDEGEQ